MSTEDRIARARANATAAEAVRNRPLPPLAQWRIDVRLDQEPLVMEAQRLIPLVLAAKSSQNYPDISYGSFQRDIKWPFHRIRFHIPKARLGYYAIAEFALLSDGRIGNQFGTYSPVQYLKSRP